MSSKHSTQAMPGHSRVWIYQANREINSTEQQRIGEILDEFLDNWAAHGTPLMAGFEVVHDRFIVLAVDEKQAQASGCSIDSSVRVFQALDQEFNLDLFNRLNLAYRNSSGAISTLRMTEFEEKLKSRELSTETIVFNNLVSDLSEFHQSWETTVANSWHAKLA